MTRAKRCTAALLLVMQFASFAAIAGTPSRAMAQGTEAECRASGGTWTPPQDNGAGVVNPGSCATAGASITSGLTNNATGGGWFYEWVWVPMVTWVGSLFLDIGAAFLRLSGYLFDILIKYVIIQFKTTLDSIGVLGAITTGWTVFRDFSNILIIGFFVFIAISIILGLGTFGDKRLIANVLVVAVLMNFSLLFTKLVIDGSNFVAFQVYSQMASANGTTASKFNIAESFLRPMQVGTVWNTYALVDEVRARTASPGQAFLFGLVGGLILLLVAFVLFYGCFLLAWRGVLFIILMLTAPLAFATYLIPTLAKSEYGWDSWWKMLLNNAAFGPLLMIMLAISLSIINAAGATAKTPIGNIISDPSKVTGEAWTTIFVYIIGVGLLFASLKLSSSFAGSIGGGFGIASGLASLLPVSLLRAPALLQRAPLIGARAQLARAHGVEEKLREEQLLQRANARAGIQTDYSRVAALAVKKAKLETKALRTFDPLNTAGGQYLAKALGAPSFAAEKSKSLVEEAKKVAEHAAKEAAGDAISQGAAREAARKSKLEAPTADGGTLAEKRQQHEETLRVETESAETAKRNERLLERLTQAQEAHRETERVATSRKVEAEEAYAGVPEGPAKAAAKAARDSAIHAEDERIKEARQRVNALQSRIDFHDAPVTAAKKMIEDIDKSVDAYAKVEGEHIRKASSEAMQESAAALTQNRFSRLIGLKPNSIAADKARALTGKKISVKSLADLRKAENDALSGAGENPTTT